MQFPTHDLCGKFLTLMRSTIQFQILAFILAFRFNFVAFTHINDDENEIRRSLYGTDVKLKRLIYKA